MPEDNFILNQILLTQNLILEKLRALDEKQQMLSIESRNNHCLLIDIQSNFQEANSYLPLIRQTNHTLVMTDQKLTEISNKIPSNNQGAGEDEEFHSVVSEDN